MNIIVSAGLALLFAIAFLVVLICIGGTKKKSDPERRAEDDEQMEALIAQRVEPQLIQAARLTN
jgi:hypothetical protein